MRLVLFLRNAAIQSIFEEVILLDRKYIENWSVWLDFMILLRTVKVVLKHECAS